MSTERRAVAKATRRLIPFLFGIYIVAYLDRVNVSFAQLQLEDDLGFSDTIFGLGAGIFSLGYVVFGVPSNLLLERFGARRWLAAIMIVWGLISASMMFIEGAASFYVMRFLLGVAEAGFFPGIVLYLTWWFPEADRARTLALFMTAISASYVIGGPLSGGLLELDGLAGLDGWQWLFLCEGLPAVGLGFVALRFLDDRPRDAAWLEADERDALSSRVEAELEAKGESGPGSGIRDALRSGQVWLCAWIYFILLSAAFGLTFFVPDLVQDRTGLSDFEVGALAAVPYGVATYAMVVLARRADRSGRRRTYVIALLLVGAAGTVFTAYAQTVLLLALALTLATIGLLAVIPIFWSLPTGFLTGGAAAAGIATIAVIGNLGGFGGPAFTGVMEDSTGDFVTPFVVLAGLLVVGCVLTLFTREPAVTGGPVEPATPAETGALRRPG
jgi:MFS family permease